MEIQFPMEQRGLTRRDLEPYIGSRARVAEVLNHERSLTLAMIRRLHNGLGIPADVLIGGNGG
jgi:HTH-type transcriptional regulator/antitoxin HigA